jgi:hypothetical protein
MAQEIRTRGRRFTPCSAAREWRGCPVEPSSRNAASCIRGQINESESVTVSLHVYGTHVNHTTRSRFDPDTHTESEFLITTA